MRIALITFGSRGDVQPYIALGKGLQQAGHDVRLVSHDPYADMVTREGLSFFPCGSDIQAITRAAQQDSGQKKTLDPIWQIRQSLRIMEPYFLEMIQRSWQASQGMDALVLNALGVLVGVPFAHKLGIVAYAAYAQPLVPTRTFPGFIAPPLPGWVPLLRTPYNLATGSLTRFAMGTLYELPTRKALRQVIGETALASALMRKHPVPILHGYSPAFLPRPTDWPANCFVTGYWFLDSRQEWQPSEQLRAFLQAGPAPVSIGFGSMNSEHPEQMTEIALHALKQTGKRGILLSGWGGIKASDLPDDVFVVDSVPHDWLFPRVAAAVHHGGAGTTGASLRAGIPTIVVPFIADQYFWGRQVYASGVGPRPLPQKRLTADTLARAIMEAVENEALRKRATSLGERIRQEDGVGRAVQLITSS
jgi:sterol 3beta-glucosyltransferase